MIVAVVAGLPAGKRIRQRGIVVIGNAEETTTQVPSRLCKRIQLVLKLNDRKVFCLGWDTGHRGVASLAWL
jgi:hypothetical protein